MPPAPSCARNRYSPITRGSSAASGFISSPRVGPALHILRHTLPTGKETRDLRSRLKAIPHSWFGEQMAGPRRVVLQLAAQAGHVEAQVVGALLIAGSPHRGQQLRRADELAGPAEQELQDPPFGRREPERVPGVVGRRAP